MSQSKLIVSVLAVCCAVTCGCATRSAERDDESMAQFASMMFPSTFEPALIAFYRGNGRWPTDMHEVMAFISMPVDPRVRSFLERITFVPQRDGSLEVDLPSSSRNPQRRRVPVPHSQKEPNKAPEPTPGPVTDRAGARSAPAPVVAHL